MIPVLKLYFSPGACSFAGHIALREAGLNFSLEKVDLYTKKMASGEDYLRINPLGYVPALECVDGSILTEAVAVLLYIADQNPQVNLIPLAGSANRYQAYRWLTLISSELHKGFGPLFKADIATEQKDAVISRLRTRFVFIEEHLSTHEWLVGGNYTVADIYAFVCLSWTGFLHIDMTMYPHITSFLARIGERPSVKASLVAEKI
ncbi:MAG: glutathione transferase GstA [Minisyncoccota bacterium]